MIAEIVATGDEIRTGALVDSNSAHISEQLEQLGVTVWRHHAVGDHLESLVAVLKEISLRADIAVVTGGLGPTPDDVSAEAAALATGRELVVDERALRDIEGFFQKFRRPMSASNRKQALIPEGARCLRNPVGTAPGFRLILQECVFYFLPGVPYEMKKMLSDKVLPDVDALLGDKEYSQVRTLASFGLPESLVGEKMASLPERFPQIKLGLRAKFPEIQIKLYGRGRREAGLEQNLDAAAHWASRKLGRHLFSMTGQSMEKVVGDLLLKRSATIAVAESCTGGLIANRLTNVAGSSAYFLFSGVTYANSAKIGVLGVPAKIIETNGAVDEETVKHMAAGARRIAGATYGLATSGIAGPDGGSPEKPVGTVCIGLATPTATHARQHLFRFGRRLMNKKIFAMAALDMLRRELIGELD
jgi:nicotinamide-nucleotide amidase